MNKMKNLNGIKIVRLILIAGLLILSVSGAVADQQHPQNYPIASTVFSTRQKTVEPAPPPATAILLSEVSKYSEFGYGVWKEGQGVDDGKRLDLMPAGYDVAAAAKKEKLLNFFAITDIHTTDKESPSQLIFLQQLIYPSRAKASYAYMTSIYSPVMLYTTHVLDAAAQTINALHKQNPIDFGISLGDTCNSTQYNELRWYIDVLDGKVITPSSGAHTGAKNIDYQKPYKAAGLDKTIPWYQVMGNHDHFWMGSIPVNDHLRKSYIDKYILAAGDVLMDPRNINKPYYYMGVLDGSTPYGNIIGAGPVSQFNKAPKVAADPDRRSLSRTEWMGEFFKTTTQPAGHGFHLVDPKQEKGFACYSFLPKATVPIKVIVLDNTQREDDGSYDIHGHGFLDPARWTWLKKELADGQAKGQLMIIAAHIPIGVEKPGSQLGWWENARNAVSQNDLVAELHKYPNLILWIAGHRHLNTVKPFPGEKPENGFWQVETSSLRDFPQQLRLFEIYTNSDGTISILITNVDPAVQDGTPAAISRKYAVAAQQIVRTNIQTNNPTGDAGIKPMPTGSYNAELIKPLSADMQAKMTGGKAPAPPSP